MTEPLQKIQRRLRVGAHAAIEIQSLTTDREELLTALREVARWFDAWCPQATCCAHTGLGVYQHVLTVLARVSSEADDCREAQDNTPSKGPFTP
jgi:hypothetical protein